ncbi:MAG: right-handed parallel beta-helix repeat-containing protein [Kiritimatiellales bacterium]
MGLGTRGFWLACNNVHVFHCEVEGFNAAGILVGGGTLPIENSRMNDNYIHDNDGIGLGHANVSRAIATGNLIRDSGLHAMTMDNISGAYNIVADNIMDTACTIAGSGVFATDNSQRLIVANNQIANGAPWGIRTPNNIGNTDGMIIIGNTLVNNGSGGISLYRDDSPGGSGVTGSVYCENCLIDNNTFVSNGRSNISIVIDDMGDACQANKIGGNNVYRNAALPTYPKQTIGTPVNFYVTYSMDQLNVPGDGTDHTVTAPNAVLNEGSGYDNTTGIFTVPRPGLYTFTIGCNLSEVDSCAP